MPINNEPANRSAPCVKFATVIISPNYLDLRYPTMLRVTLKMAFATFEANGLAVAA